MLSLVVAAVSSALWGASDVFSGEGARRLGVLRATLLSFCAGAVVLVVLVAVTRAPVTAAGLGFGALAGAATIVGFVAFYAAMAAGAMGVVASGAALLQAIVPVLVGILILHDEVGAGAWIGLALALPASVLLTVDGRTGRMSTRTIVATVVAGLAFGASVVALAAAPVDAGLVPAGVEITLGAIVLGVFAAAAPRVGWVGRFAAFLDPPDAVVGATRSAVVMSLGGGAALGLANAALVVALHLGQLTLVAVVLSLYPAATALLARLVLRERLRPRQLTGIGLALAAGAALALPV